jgi:hypothetical protein
MPAFKKQLWAAHSGVACISMGLTVRACLWKKGTMREGVTEQNVWLYAQKSWCPIRINHKTYPATHKDLQLRA